jgi:glycerol-1-phosphate dehydrogenase [NAD(P)+]
MNEAFPIKRIEIDYDNIQKIKDILGELGVKSKVTIVCDADTYEAAGKKVVSILENSGFILNMSIIGGNGLLTADERALGQILVNMDTDTEMLIAVGSGTINDLTRYISYKTGVPYGVIATAPSMDGYASTVSPLIINGFKRTYEATHPEFILGDVNILSNAPYHMITAGFGDILGKFTSLADWKISHMINGEKLNEDIYEIVKGAVDRCVQTSLSLAARNKEAVLNVIKALVDSGTAMLKYGNSRPASGAEHHLAHYLEMQDMIHGRTPHLHGTKVGVTAVIIAEIYHRVFSLNKAQVEELIAKRSPENPEIYVRRIREKYGFISDELLLDLEGFYVNEKERRIRQLKIVENWDYLRSWVLVNVPKPQYIQNLLQSVNAPSLPEEVGLERGDISDSLVNAKEVRKRYTILRLIEDIGIEYDLF